MLSRDALPNRIVILCILAAETGERFAYFGFRALLVLYFVNDLKLNESQAIAAYAFNAALAYATPLIGAILADGYLGRYRTILYFSGVYLCGLTVLTISASSSSIEVSTRRLLTIVGLFLACMGTGGIKPCVSAFGADQITLSSRTTATATTTVTIETTAKYKDDKDSLDESDTIQRIDDNDDALEIDSSQDQDTLVRSFFANFYVCINIGALTSIALVPIIRSKYGFGAGFGVPTIFMLLSVTIFWSQRRLYKHQKKGESSSLLTTFRLVWWLLRRNLYNNNNHTMLEWLRPGPLSRHLVENNNESVILSDTIQDCTNHNDNQDNYKRGNSGHVIDDTLNNYNSSPFVKSLQQQLDDAAQALHILPIMALLPIFWCLYDQQSSVWTLQATRMNLHIFEPEQLNMINPLEIMILVPLFDQVIYPFLQKRNVNLAPIRRMGWGMLLAALSFIVSGLLETAIQRHNVATISVFWQMPQITILAMAEIFLSVTGLEFAYANSSPRLKALVLALFFVTTAVGDLLSGGLYSTVFTHFNRATVMHVCGGLMLTNYVAFYRVANWWQQCNYTDWRPVVVGVSHNEDEDSNRLDSTADSSSNGLELPIRHHSFD